MKYAYSLLAFFLTFPYIALGATQESVQTFGIKLIIFFNTTFVPFLFAVALLIFIFNIVRYFIIEIDNVTSKETAKRYAIYSIGGFVLMVSIWGIINLFVDGIGLGQENVVCSDIPGIPCDRGGYRDTYPGLNDPTWSGGGHEFDGVNFDGYPGRGAPTDIERSF